MVIHAGRQSGWGYWGLNSVRRVFVVGASLAGGVRAQTGWKVGTWLWLPEAGQSEKGIHVRVKPAEDRHMRWYLIQVLNPEQMKKMSMEGVA